MQEGAKSTSSLSFHPFPCLSILLPYPPLPSCGAPCPLCPFFFAAKRIPLIQLGGLHVGALKAAPVHASKTEPRPLGGLHVRALKALLVQGSRTAVAI